MEFHALVIYIQTNGVTCSKIFAGMGYAHATCIQVKRDAISFYFTFGQINGTLWVSRCAGKFIAIYLKGI